MRLDVFIVAMHTGWACERVVLVLCAELQSADQRFEARMHHRGIHPSAPRCRKREHGDATRQLHRRALWRRVLF